MKTFRHISLISVILLLAVTGAYASAENYLQQKKNKKVKISGVVTDGEMNPVQGVRIFVDQANSNTITDAKGFYRVTVPSTSKVISAFSSRYGVQKIAIKSDLSTVGNVVINIKLVDVNAFNSGEAVEDFRADDPAYNEEVINIGYGVIKKKNLTTEVNKISGQHSYQAYSNMYDMIRGEIPGVEVNGKTIRIRDAFSFNLSTEPLFVMDGIIIPTLDDISPIDVKSIEVLKGAAASVYGSRGANGVILITTMKGGDR